MNHRVGDRLKYIKCHVVCFFHFAPYQTNYFWTLVFSLFSIIFHCENILSTAGLSFRFALKLSFHFNPIAWVMRLIIKLFSTNWFCTPRWFANSFPFSSNILFRCMDGDCTYRFLQIYMLLFCIHISISHCLNLYLFVDFSGFYVKIIFNMSIRILLNPMYEKAA